MSEAVSVRLPSDLMEKMAREALEKNVNLSELIRQKIIGSYDMNDAKKIVDTVSNIKTFLNRFNQEKEKSDSLNEQLHMKNNQSISSLEKKISEEFIRLNSSIKNQNSLFEETYPKKDSDKKHSWADTLNNFFQAPGFYFFNIMILVLFTSIVLSFHFTGNDWPAAFSSFNNFLIVFKLCFDIFMSVFATIIIIYPFMFHLTLKHLVRFGWHQEIRFMKR